MKFISIQPDSEYFIWQLQVQMNNFRKFDIEKDAIILFAFDAERGVNPKAVRFSTRTKATTFFFSDKRNEDHSKYIASIKPHILKQFFFKHSEKYNDDFFIHDSDILFRELPDFTKLVKKKKILLSDTVSYIGADYIKSKGEGLLEEMCGVVGIDPNIVIANEKKSGGAQYLIPKNIPMTYEFWNKVELDSVNLFNLMVNTSNKYNPLHPIQSWTAEMWAILWNFWLEGYDTPISKDLAFSWPTLSINEWPDYKIFHNAGVTPDRKELFFKGDFTSSSPFSSSFDNVSDKFCTIKYVEEIIETGKLLNSNQ